MKRREFIHLGAGALVAAQLGGITALAADVPEAVPRQPSDTPETASAGPLSLRAGSFSVSLFTLSAPTQSTASFLPARRSVCVPGETIRFFLVLVSKALTRIQNYTILDIAFGPVGQ